MFKKGILLGSALFVLGASVSVAPTVAAAEETTPPNCKWSWLVPDVCIPWCEAGVKCGCTH